MYEELKIVAELAKAGGFQAPTAYEEDRKYRDPEIAYWDFAEKATPSAVLALIAENEKIRGLLAEKLIGKTMLTGIIPEDGGMTIGLEGGACAIMADVFGEQLYTSEAENYIELSFGSGKYPALGQIVVTVKRETGKTPHQLRSKAEQERDQLKAENEVARMRVKELDLLFGRYILAMRSALIEEDHGLGAEAGMMWVYNSLVGPGELPPEDATNAQAYFDAEIVAVDKGMEEVFAFHVARRKAKAADK